MNISNLVPSLETCKKLQELGFPQETYFDYCKIIPPRDSHQPYNMILNFFGVKYFASCDGGKVEFLCPAPTLQEIWEQLPSEIKDSEWEHTFDLYIHTDGMGYELVIPEPTGDIHLTRYDVCFSNFTSLVEAAAQLWIIVNTKKEEG